MGLTDDSHFAPARNNGRSRTPEKRDLMRFIEDEAGRQGREPWTISRD